MKNKIEIDMRGMEYYLRELEEMGGNTRRATETVLQKAAEKVQADVRDAVEKQNLPAGGKYSTGDTANAIVEPHVEWHGTLCSAPVGFDYTKSGAGGYLISGTPKMRPDQKLHAIFREKSYMRKLSKEIGEEALKILIEETK